MTFPILALAALLAAAQAPPRDDPAGDEIVVTGTRDGTLDLKRLQAAQTAFRQGHAAFAPQSVLRFQIKPHAGLRIEGMTLTLGDGARATPLPIDAAGRFALPETASGGTLFHNRGAAHVAIRVLVFSPGATEGDRPLGDMRLQCRAGWEVLKAGVSFVARGMFGAAGGCASRRIGFYFTTPRPIRAATVTSGARTDVLAIRATHTSYRVPLADRTLPNDARIHLDFQ